MCSRAQSESATSARWSRAICAAIAFVVWIIFQLEGGGRPCGCAKQCVLPLMYAALTVGVPTTLLHIWFWGLADSVKTGALLVVLPAVAVVAISASPKSKKTL